MGQTQGKRHTCRSIIWWGSLTVVDGVWGLGMIKFFGCIFTTLLLLTVQGANAADFSRKIPTGASYADVMNLWGEPVEKVEEGILKQSIWYYKDGAKVVFKEGRVRSFRPTNTVIAQQASLEEARRPVDAAAVELAGETRDLVRDIAKEVPSGPDVPYVEPPLAAQPPIVPNQIPPGGRGAAPAIIPADDLLEEE